MSDQQIQTVRPLGDFLLGPVMDLEMAKTRLAQFQEFVRSYLIEDEDFGKIPGTPKPTLLKPGADKLCELYGLADDYEVTEKVENYETGLFDYTIKCIITSRRDGRLVSTGMGSCNSYEKKYRWRSADRLCPNCQSPAIMRSKAEYGGGWFCFGKKGGCGAKFPDNDPAIANQSVGRVQNEDIADTKNTILKMAKKRAKIDATLSATRSSGIFTQDLEDMPRGDETADRRDNAPPVEEKQQNKPQDPGKGAEKPKQSPVTRSAFFGNAKELGWGLDALKKLLTEMFKTFDTTKLTPEQMAKALGIMKQGEPAEVLANLDQYNF
jgi:hypothetical protein